MLTYAVRIIREVSQIYQGLKIAQIVLQMRQHVDHLKFQAASHDHDMKNKHPHINKTI